jgi:3-deoxy-D-manno-octulosonic-acid transferase
MGELLHFYAASDVAFVGGSLEKIGGHNVLEPAALSRPVVFGPHTFNFEDICQRLIDCGGAVRVEDEEQLESVLRKQFSEPDLRDRMGRAGFDLVRSGQGALDQTMEIVDRLITATTD